MDDDFDGPIPTEVVKTFSLKLLLPNGSVVNETVDREENMSTELFNALVGAIVRKNDATVLDIKEV